MAIDEGSGNGGNTSSFTDRSRHESQASHEIVLTEDQKLALIGILLEPMAANTLKEISGNASINEIERNDDLRKLMKDLTNTPKIKEASEKISLSIAARLMGGLSDCFSDEELTEIINSEPRPVDDHHKINTSQVASYFLQKRRQK